MNEGLSWSGINLLVSFQDVTNNMLCNLGKISHPADLEICKFNMELIIELYWWHAKCLLRSKLLKIRQLPHHHGLSQYFQCQPKAHCIQTWYDNLLHTTFCNNKFSWLEYGTFNVRNLHTLHYYLQHMYLRGRNYLKLSNHSKARWQKNNEV